MEQIQLPKKCIQIESGSNTQYYLLENGTVWGKGNNKNGQLGITTPEFIYDVQQIPGLQNIISITSSGEYTLFLDKVGDVYGCGSNSMLTLGIFPPTSFGIVKPGTNTNITSVKKIPNISNIIYIKASVFTSYFIDRFGNLSIYGRNPLDGNKPIKKLTTISLNGIIQVYDFFGSRYYIANTGNVYVHGSPFSGLYHKDTTIVPFLYGVQSIQFMPDYTLYTKFDGKVFIIDTLGNKLDIDIPNVKKIVGYRNRYMFLTIDGKLQSLDSNDKIKVIRENINDIQFSNIGIPIETSLITVPYLSILDNQGNVFQYQP